MREQERKEVQGVGVMQEGREGGGGGFQGMCDLHEQLCMLLLVLGRRGFETTIHAQWPTNPAEKRQNHHTTGQDQRQEKRGGGGGQPGDIVNLQVQLSKLLQEVRFGRLAAVLTASTCCGGLAVRQSTLRNLQC